MPAEYIAPAGVRDGDPQALAELCAIGGSAVVAYCEAAGASPRVAGAAVWAMADFRRRLVASGDLAGPQLELLLMSVSRDAALREGGASATRERLREADATFGTVPPGRLGPGLAREMIAAVVAAAPVAHVYGDATAVLVATEQRYERIFGSEEALVAPPPADTRAGEQQWVPAQLLVGDGPADDTGAGSAGSRWHAVEPVPEPPADGGLDVAPPGSPVYAPPAAAWDHVEPSALEHAHHLPPLEPAPPRRSLRSRLPRLPKRRRGPKNPPGGAPRHDRRALVAFAVAAIAIAVAVFVLATPQPLPKEGAIRVRPLDIPFDAAGAVFEVARTRTAEWAIDLRRREPRQGRTWITLAVHTRNVDRANFHPRALGYRLRTNSGIVIGPETATVPDALFDTGGRLLAGKRASVHLGFQVPQAKSDLTLEFDPGPGSRRIRVPLN